MKSNYVLLTVNTLSEFRDISEMMAVGEECRVPQLANLTLRKNKKSTSIIFRAEVKGERIVRKIGEIFDTLEELNSNLARMNHEVSYKKGESSQQMTLALFIYVHFLPTVERELRDVKNLKSRLAIISDTAGSQMDELLENIRKIDVINLLERIRTERGVSPSTLERYRYAIQSVFSLAVEMELIANNPVKTIRKERINNVRTRVLRGRELELFIVYASQYSNPHAGGALLFLLFTGMRAMECLTCKWSMVSLCGNFIDLPISKSGKPRRVYLNQSAKNVLARMQELKMGEYIFYSQKNGHLSYPKAALRAVIAQLESARELTAPLNLHALRHTFATTMIESTNSLRATQIALGHGSSSMTERYTHLSNDHLSNSVAQLDHTFKFESTQLLGVK